MIRVEHNILVKSPTIMKIKIIVALLFVALMSPPDTQAQFMGEISMFAGEQEPEGWAFCHGQLLPVEEWPALFSIMGTTYGGDGRTTMGLPDLRGRTPIGVGSTSAMPLSDIHAHENGAHVLLYDAALGSWNREGLGVNYIICLYGTFPYGYIEPEQIGPDTSTGTKSIRDDEYDEAP